MPKPKVIIADDDINYIVPFQLKFAEEYFEKVDLELITDIEVFKNKFSEPQRANVLIIAESLYDPSLQRHNIDNIYLMSEQEKSAETESPNITRLYKYTNIKTIFSQIAGNGFGNAELSVKKQSSQLITITSASGGTGKSTVSLAISRCLASMGKKVLYINADYVQSFQYHLSDSSPISDSKIYDKLAETNNLAYSCLRHVIRKEAYYYIPPFKSAIMSVGLKYAVYEKIAENAKESNDYDFVIVDAANTFEEINASLMRNADKVIIVTKQNAQAVFAARLLLSNINGISADKYFLVCNDYDRTKENALLSSELTAKFAVNEYIGHIPDCDRMSVDEIANNAAFQRISFLLV